MTQTDVLGDDSLPANKRSFAVVTIALSSVWLCLISSLFGYEVGSNQGYYRGLLAAYVSMPPPPCAKYMICTTPKERRP